ncbi:uncharacterized protein Tco025E_02362, partial [Trypanosoma conorhini]
MSHERGNSIEATVDEVLRSISVTPDCQIESHLNGAEEDIASKLDLGSRIVEVDGQTVTDSGELREVLLSGDLSRKVSMKYEKVNEPVQQVKIEGSVRYDGRVSALARQPSRDAVMSELADEDTSLTTLQQTAFLTSPSKSPKTTSRSDGSPSVANSASKTEAEVDNSSIASSSAFTAANMGDAPDNNMSTAEYNRKSDVPQLLEFEQITTPVLPEEFNTQSRRASEGTVRRRIMQAVEMVPLGACVICVCHEVNPIAEIELVAMTLNRPIVTVDLGVKLRLRPKPEAFAEQFKAAMHEGAWFVLINAHKSIATCRVLEELLKEIESRNFEGISPNARVIICMEAHPHFPQFL